MSFDRLIALVSSCDASILLQPTAKQPKQNSRLGAVEQAQARTPEYGEAESLKIAMRLQYKGRERTTELSLTQDVIRQLLSHAESRQIGIGDLIADLLLTVAKKDLFRQVLDTRGTNALAAGSLVVPAAT